jgi:hypothetical protein
MMVEAINVVHVTMLYSIALGMTLVQVVPRHGHFWPVEDTGFIHIVPSVQVGPVMRIEIEREELRPLLAHYRATEIWIEGRSRPTPAIILAPTARLREVVEVPQCLENVVTFVTFDMWVNDGDKLSLVFP